MATVRATLPARSAILQERLLAELLRFRKFMRLLVRDKLAVAGLVIILAFVGMAIAAPLLVGPYPGQLDRTTPLLPPSGAHPLGTDWQGFDTLKLLAYGGRVSLVIGFVASFVAMVLGTSVGLVA